MKTSPYISSKEIGRGELMADLNITNGKVFLKDRLVEASVSVSEGKVAAIVKSSSLPDADRAIGASHKIILPGGIDVHTHVEDLTYAYREDFVTGTQAAVSGGMTTICEMPLGLEGKTALEAFDMQLAVMQKKSLVDFGIIGAAGYNSIDFIQELARNGAIAFKTFMTDPPEEEAELRDLGAKNDYFFLKIFSEIAKTGLVSSVHAENKMIIAQTIKKLLSTGRKDFQAHTDSRPVVAEEEACMRAMILAHHAGAKLNLVHMSSKNAFAFIRDAKAKEWDVTCEITPHHLFLTSEDGARIGSWAKVDPPLRPKEHLAAAWQALNDGTIDMVASDHSPYGRDEKEIHDGNIFECGSGCPGIETLRPLMFDAVNKKRTTLTTLVNTTSLNPARRFGIYPRKGVIAVGADADLVIVDMKKEYTLKNEEMYTKPKITVFDGMKIRGVVEKTIVRGTIIYDSGEFCTEKGHGIFIRPCDKKK
jgi:dihydropyrimidinase/allantoinase